MTAEELVSPSAIHFESDPPALWSFECLTVGCAYFGVSLLDRCCIRWLAECPIIAIPVCLATRLALDAVACDVIACTHYRMPLSG